MQLRDLLHELRSNILHDRSDQVAGASDYLWDDVTLCRYIDAAHRRFAKRALILRDGKTPQVAQIHLRTGVDMYALHQSVVAVLSAKLTGDNADLARAGHSQFDTYRTPDTYFFNPAELSSKPPGRPLAYDTDEDLVYGDDNALSVVNFRIWPVPTVTYNNALINLRVVRLPLNRLTLDNLDAQPEIPEDLQIDMLDWAAYLALRINDLDQEAPVRAQEFKASFEAHVLEAKNELKRKTFTPAQWAFGGNGFSWEH